MVLLALAAALRIVSLIPSLTEDLFALGVGASVVGVSEFSDYPPAARALPRVGSFAAIDAERIIRLHPSLIVGIPAQAPLVAPLVRAGLRVRLLADDRYDDIFADLVGLGQMVGREAEARSAVTRLRARTASLTAGVDRARRPSAFVVLGVAPLYTVGARSYIAALIRMAGGRNAALIDTAYSRYSAEALLRAQPDVILADPASGLRGVIEREPWRSLVAVRRGRVAYVDAELMRPGPRYNDGLSRLIEIFRGIE